jgi:hypothetical protein
MYKNIFFILFLLTAGCDTNTTAYKPISSGKIHAISVVIDNKLWSQSPGEELKKVYSSEFLGLPQQEPLFTLNQIPPSIFTDFTRESRNVIVVSKSTKDSAFINSDKYASPQKILYINGKTNKSLVDQINKTARKAIKTFKANEIKEKQKRIKKSILKTKEFDSLGISLTMSSGYKLFKKETVNKLWFQRETQKGSVNILAYILPYSSANPSLERIISIRDSIGKAFVPGRNKDSYLITEEAYMPYFFKTKINSLTAFETRGTWEVVNDYMAGPFLNYFIKDKKNNRTIVLEGFVFSPSVRKREYLVEIEAIIRSLKIL